MIEVGEYGRTNFGKIIKFAWYEKEKGILNDKAVILVDKMRTTTDCFYYFEKGECIVKHSKNIIDLIEEGDYVNGERVKMHYESGVLKIPKKIKSLVTKEQFSSIEYKVKED